MENFNFDDEFSLEDLKLSDEELLEKDGWDVECESPLEIRRKDGYSFASGYAAKCVIDNIKDSIKLSHISVVVSAHRAKLIDSTQFTGEVTALFTDDDDE